ncbi:MAG TPA: LON peptidase substrate-binding domain-containing protein, partial [Ktedonobacteraceae bacterium]|nr:LON peptidase substrate-binding domain-containing protein [Ktedonobacteraceae bacterium]
MVTKKATGTSTRKRVNRKSGSIEKDILQLPLLPIRNTVLLPNMVTPLIVSQEQSLKALEEAMKGDRLLFVVTQLDEDLENPGQNDVYTVGVEGMIDRVLKMPDGTTSVLVHGQRRLRRIEYTQELPFIRV